MARFFNRKVTLDGHTFDSKKEASRYSELFLLQSSGAITDLSLHPEFELFPSFLVVENGKKKTIRKAVYTADFSYREPGNPRIIVEDVKDKNGFRTQVSALRCKIFLFRYKDSHELRIIA